MRLFVLDMHFINALFNIEFISKHQFGDGAV